MNPWNSFLQTVFQFVKSLFTGVTKKMHRNAAILTMGATLIAVIPFTAVDFQGGGKNAIVAFAETQGGSDEDSLEETEDTALPETDGNVLEDETTADEHHPRRRKQISRKKLKIQRRMIRTAPRTQELRKKQTRAMGLRMSLRGRKWKLRETQRPELCRLRRKQKAHL